MVTPMQTRLSRLRYLLWARPGGTVDASEISMAMADRPTVKTNNLFKSIYNFCIYI